MLMTLSYCVIVKKGEEKRKKTRCHRFISLVCKTAAYIIGCGDGENMQIETMSELVQCTVYVNGPVPALRKFIFPVFFCSFICFLFLFFFSLFSSIFAIIAFCFTLSLFSLSFSCPPFLSSYLPYPHFSFLSASLYSLI